MKKIRRLAEQTHGLRAFVDEFPKERDWEAFRNHDANKPYKELIEALVAIQHGCCCYCEIALQDGDRQIEHFIPKSTSDNENNYTMDFTNLLAACCGGTTNVVLERRIEPLNKNLSCGQSKDNTVVSKDFDPRNLPSVVSLFLVSLDSCILKPDKIACKNEKIEPSRVEDIIVLLGLNCKRLISERLKRREALEKSYNDVDAQILIAAAREELLPDKMGRLLPFFTTARTFFGEAAELVLAEQPQTWI